MARRQVVVFPADFLFQLFKFRGEEFHRRATFGADHVVVSAAVVLVLVAGDAVVEGDFGGEPALGEELEGAIHGGEADLRVLFANLAVEFVGGQVVALLEKSLQDRVALAGQLQPYPLKVPMEDVGRLAEHFTRDGRLIIDPLWKHV